MMATRTRSCVALVAAAVLTALLLAGTATGQDAVSVLGMAWTPKPAPSLVISASGPLKFTRARPEPGVVLIDFPAAVPASPIAAVEQPAAGLRRASLETTDEGGKPGTRLRLETDPGVKVVVNELPSGLEVRFESGAQSEPSPRGELVDVLPVADPTGVSVQLVGAGPLEGKSFTLADPPRVVVDFKGVINKVARRVQPVGAAGVLRVRVAQHATAPEPIVRVVVDLDQPLPYQLTSTPQGAVLRLGAEPAQVVAGTTPAVPPSAEAPQQTAQAAPVPSAPVAAPAVAEPAAATSASPEPVAAAPASPEPAATAPAVSAAPAVPPAPVPPPAPAPTKADEETPVAPVKIVDEPPPAPKIEATPAPVTPAPPTAVGKAATSSLVAPPAPATREAEKPASKSDSPWTTSPAAMAEQAAPPTTITTGTRELETQVKQFTGEPISLELKDADIKDVLRTFAQITQLNVVVDPEVRGSVTVNLHEVPWDQCLDIILRINGLDYVLDNNVLRVATTSKLQSERAAQADLRKAEENSTPMRTVTKTLSYAKADAVSSLLTSKSFILSDRGSVVVDTRTNQLIIRDSTDRIQGILALIDTLDQPNPQVMIEARIVETTRTFSQSLGVTWGFNLNADTTHGTNTGWRFPNQVNGGGGVDYSVPSNGFIGGVTSNNIIQFAFADVLDSFNLDFALSAAESAGLVKIVSSPKVTAQNNELAHIQSGILLPTQTVANNTVTVQYIDATLSLDVRPQITAEGTVLLDIDLKKREPLAGINLQNATNVPISTRDARTHLMVRDGGTTVIGGIFKATDQDQKNGIPGLNRLPVVGALFRNRQTSSEHDELLIFITPRIIKY
ncbi:MAG: type IV pilus secretin PilQ [Thermoanaerobaculales bacterium]